MHQWVSEFVTQYWFSMYYGSSDIWSLTAILLFSMFPDLRNNLKSSRSSLYACSISYSTLKRSFAPRIPTTTSATRSPGPGALIFEYCFTFGRTSENQMRGTHSDMNNASKLLCSKIPCDQISVENSVYETLLLTERRLGDLKKILEINYCLCKAK
jgi:hypothetical protein